MFVFEMLPSVHTKTIQDDAIHKKGPHLSEVLGQKTSVLLLSFSFLYLPCHGGLFEKQSMWPVSCFFLLSVGGPMGGRLIILG